MQSSRLIKIIIIALFGTISFLLFLLKFPLPLLPPYLKIDFGEVPALMAGLIFSPLAGVFVVLVKNGLYLIIGGGEPVGVTANIIAAIAFILPVSIFYHKYKNVKSIVSGLITGTIIMAISMSIFNYLVILVIYTFFIVLEMSKIELINR